MRTHLDNVEEFNILEKVVRRYKFNLVHDGPEEISIEANKKRKLYFELSRIEEE